MNIDLNEPFKSDFVPLLALFIFNGKVDLSMESPSSDSFLSTHLQPFKQKGNSI